MIGFLYCAYVGEASNGSVDCSTKPISHTQKHS
jgi:hypothetical protein